MSLVTLVEAAGANPLPISNANRTFEWTFESRKLYQDPFNNVNVDVIFTRDGESWRVPAFWRGGNKWTIRFAPPSPGVYRYHLESTDKNNPDLNGHEGRVTIAPYTGTNVLLRHGKLKLSANRRYFEHADGTPFYWLGDTWWTGLSDRLSWDGFQKLTADRKTKGFTVVQIVAGLIPSNEELAPVDPGFRNEGGAVWDSEFKRINPQYFDYADRRVQRLIDSGIVPAIVGGWNQVLAQMGVARMKQHWRYIIARYGAYPVFWIVGGEIIDPPMEAARKLPPIEFFRPSIPGGWTEVARYIRDTDPYHHPVTAHERPARLGDYPVQDESVLDFDFPQPSHFDWPSIAEEVAQLNMHTARTSVTKPIVVSEIGYEMLGGHHLEDFQRVAFWLAMLNGAAGHTYGAQGTFEAYTADKPLHRRRWSFLSWEEGMKLPGSTQVGLGSKLLRQYRWWRFEPHPEWISPRGTTLLEPRSDINGFDVGGEWEARGGNFRLPYAAGIPGEVRFIYMPYFGLTTARLGPPTVLRLEPNVHYHAYYWEPSLGIKMDLGAVELPAPGAVIRRDTFYDGSRAVWIDHENKSVLRDGKLSSSEAMLSLMEGVSETNLVAAVDAKSDADAGLILRYQDAGNHVAAVYSSKEKAIYVLDRGKGADGPSLGATPVPLIGSDIRLAAEVRGGMAAVSVSDGQRTYTTPIVPVNNTSAGGAGLMHRHDGSAQSFDNFEIRQSPTLVRNDHLDRKLYDASGGYRGEMVGPGWDDFGKNKIILLDSYRPERLPFPQDWVLVLERRK